MNNATTIYVQNLTLGYGQRTLFSGVNAEFCPSTLTAVIGRNGQGKSSLMRTIAALNTPQQGEVLIEQNGTQSPIHSLSVKSRAQLLSFVSTEPITMGGLKVESVVGLGLSPYTNIFGTIDQRHQEIIYEALTLVDMVDFAQRDIDTLSDGERGRVMIARALAQQTPVIILDEPTAFLDLPNKYQISKLLERLAHEMHKTIIFTSHDLDIAIELCDRFVVVDNGKLVCGTPQELLQNGTIREMLRGAEDLYDKLIGGCK